MTDYEKMETAIYRGQEVEVRDKLPSFGKALILYHGTRIEVDISELSFLPDRDAEIATLKERNLILRDKLETAEDTIKRLRPNQIPEMGDLSHNARAAFYKSVLPASVIEAWQAADKVLNEGGDYKKACVKVYDSLDDILAEFDLFYLS